MTKIRPCCPDLKPKPDPEPKSLRNPPPRTRLLILVFLFVLVLWQASRNRWLSPDERYQTLLNQKDWFRNALKHAPNDVCVCT